MYDEECYRLAQHFLVDAGLEHSDKAKELAQYIQDEIESWLEGNDL